MGLLKFILDSNTKNLPVVDFIVTGGDADEVLGTVIFEVIVGFVVSVDRAVAEELLGTVGRVLAVELLITSVCTVVTKRKKIKIKG